MQGQQTGDEGVTTPRSHHVAVRQRAKSTPQHRALLQRLDPEEEGEDQQEDGNSLVIVAASNRARDVTRGDSHENRSQQTGGRVRGHLVGEEVCGVGGQTRKCRGEENADVADIDWDGQGAESVVDDAAGDHETGVESTTGDTAKRVPCSVIEPVPETVEAIGDEVLGCSEVEPGIEFVNDTLETWAIWLVAVALQVSRDGDARKNEKPMPSSNNGQQLRAEITNRGSRSDLRITENSRLETAAPAISRRMTTRSSVRELFPLPPPARRSREELVADIMAGRECGLNQLGGRKSRGKLSHRWGCSTSRAHFWRGQFGASSLVWSWHWRDDDAGTAGGVCPAIVGYFEPQM